MKNTFLVILILVLCGCGKKVVRKNNIAEPCSVTKVGNEATISCPDGTTVTLIDGLDGQNGTDAPQTTLLDPCGDAPNIYDEVLLVIEGVGVMAVFDGGPQWDRLSLLPDGSYQTTDQSGCTFDLQGGQIRWPSGTGLWQDLPL